MSGVSIDMVGKTADWLGEFADAVGKQLGQDEAQPTAELAARIFVAVAQRILSVHTPLVAGATLARGEFEGAVDEVVELARSV